MPANRSKTKTGTSGGAARRGSRTAASRKAAHDGDVTAAPVVPAVGRIELAAFSESTAPAPTGDQIVAVARAHIGEPYVLGARAPMANPSWRGPWDCAEFASWCVRQATGILYGTRPEHDPVLADAYTGYWGEQAERDGAVVPIGEAVRITGACLLRKPGQGPIGHIAISLGDGRTIEAHSTSTGVIEHVASGRRWDYGVLVPGVRYFRGENEIAYVPPERVLRLTTPLTRGETVRRLQSQLLALGYAPGDIDGVYGPQTASAVRAFQADHGLVADGEAGTQTLRAVEASAHGTSPSVTHA